MEDDALVAALRAQSDDALLALITAHGEFVRAVIKRHLPAAEAQNALKDVENRVYYKVWTRIGQFDPAKGAFSSWLGAIAKHQAVDYVRGLAGNFDALDIDTVYLAAPPAASPDALADLLAPLEPRARQVFTLYFVQGLTPAEIAKQLKCSRAAVYQDLSRGRKKLRQGRA
ncbi:RNA polymerase sigma factor [Lacticaseibacillus daqingensis]|uniref:RNA polymerase sigma factor n=1 Tax=Lacticaseibacillus daqingensis TaxID=2486014 RepID=UPI0013DDC4E9|nr:sigma-70 family RNA polymerase sigma factor [Lacticaseibacillus daqingensis]